MVIYTHSKDDKDRVHRKLSEICNREEIDCRIRFRRAGHYWQDRFPELFGKLLRSIKPFCLKFFKFQKESQSSFRGGIRGKSDGEDNEVREINARRQ